MNYSVCLDSDVVVSRYTYTPARNWYDNHYLEMGLDAQLEWIEWVDDVMLRKDVQRILGLKKTPERWGPVVDGNSWVFRIWSDQISLGLDSLRWGEILYTTRCTASVGWQYSMVSIGSYEFCLSHCVAKGWRQKEINPFVSGARESVNIIIIIDIIMAIQYIFCSLKWKYCFLILIMELSVA